MFSHYYYLLFWGLNNLNLSLQQLQSTIKFLRIKVTLTRPSFSNDTNNGRNLSYTLVGEMQVPNTLVNTLEEARNRAYLRNEVNTVSTVCHFITYFGRRTRSDANWSKKFMISFLEKGGRCIGFRMFLIKDYGRIQCLL